MHFSFLFKRLLSIGCAVALPAALMAADSGTELKLKAAYLYNFAKFVTWSPSAFTAPTQPLTVCTYGASPLALALEDTLRTKMVDGHPLTVRQLNSPSDVTGCAIVYVPATAPSRISALLPSAKSADILTIGEESSAQRAAAGDAMITLFAEDNRIRFAINNRAAEKGGIVISSKLLSLAVSVER